VYFWSNENDEPIHVHIGKGRPSAHSTKVWLTSTGGCVLAHNNGHIPKYELNALMEVIAAQYFFICQAWKEHFVVDKIKFCC
jgi:hypothetical protein